MHIVSNIALISINETLLIQLLSFLVFLFVINRLMFRPLRRTIRDRDAYVKSLKQGVADADADLKDLTREFRRQEMKVKQEAYRAREELEHAGAEEADRHVADARSEISARRDTAQKRIADDIAKARRSLEGESAVLARQIMEKVLERSLSS
jgi:F-type H+-transporting ATPase subunit b